MFDILFVSTLCSDNMYNFVTKTRTKASLDPAQRLFLTVVRELVEMGNSVTCISVRPFSGNITDLSEFERIEEVEAGVKYIYPAFRVPTKERLVDLYKNSKKEVEDWINESADNKVLICDSLVIPSSLVARKLAKGNGIPTIAYVTDYPSLATSIKTTKKSFKSLLQKSFDTIADMDLRRYDSYILVAEPLMKLIRQSKKPYIVIEDIADPPSAFIKKTNIKKDFNIVYGGALCTRFGIDKLVDCVKQVNNKKVTMTFYGSGESVEYIRNASEKDERIKYGGLLPYDEIQAVQRNADLLINPRPSDEEFAAYSFPSKTMSYMLTKTPVLSTRIPGIPKEYEPYIIWFNREDVDSMAEMIDKVSEMNPNELHELGEKAFDFICINKNKRMQCERIVELINNISRK